MVHKGLLKEYSQALSLLMRILDIILVFAAGWIAYILKFQVWLPTSSYFFAMSSGVILAAFILSFFNIYTSARGQGYLSHFIKLFQVVCALALALGSLAFFTKSGEDFSRAWYVIWMGFIYTFLTFSRCALFLLLRFMRSHGLNERNVVIIGAGELGAKLAETIQQSLWTGFRIVTFVDDSPLDERQTIHGIPVIQTPQHLSDYLIKMQIDEIWLALPLREEARVKKILYDLRHHPMTTRFVLDIFGLDLLNHSISDIAGFPVLNVCSSPMIGVNRLLKAMEDRLLAGLILLIISPIFLLIALLVKLTSQGPVFFKQQRLGWDGRIIMVYKFRTMYLHHETVGQVTQATVNDKRITSLGKWLRKTSLDELPQFINVLQGRMSIVGPRPHALAHNEQYKHEIDSYMQRHRVKPGITGWAQVNGWRGETDTLIKMKKRVEYDLYYINNWSLGFDIKIIILTLFRGFIGRNVY
jgi:putative colanic acid biosynthesis UDP-glucose lipid carrier transferase